MIEDEPSGREMLDAAKRSALRDLKQRLTAAYGDRLDKLVLYGSRARGDAELDSDVDVAVVVRELSHDDRERIFQIVAEVEVEHVEPLSTLLLSSAQYAELLGRERRLALDIQREGIPL